MIRLHVELEQDKDGRWLCEVPAIPGAVAYGATEAEALRRAEAIALSILADKLESGEPLPDGEELLTVSFQTA